jgi:CubicO group peptidase (beta-lactamase class C family)
MFPITSVIPSSAPLPSSPVVREAAYPDEPSIAYHFQWWSLVNSGAYMARGLQGQVIYIDPAADTVVVKLSSYPSGNIDAGVETLGFLQAVSRWQVP